MMITTDLHTFVGETKRELPCRGKLIDNNVVENVVKK